jgi:hypothetical protein
VQLCSLPTELLSEVLLHLPPADALSAMATCKALHRALLGSTHTVGRWLAKHRPDSAYRAASYLGPERAQQVFSQLMSEQLGLDAHALDVHQCLPLHYACERGLGECALRLVQVGV